MISKLNHIEETGPRDGTVILSDCGFCRWLAHEGRKATWLECDPSGNVYMGSFGDAIECSPTFWIRVPSWIKQQP